jgi:hypothetical protein
MLAIPSAIDLSRYTGSSRRDRKGRARQAEMALAYAAMGITPVGTRESRGRPKDVLHGSSGIAGGVGMGASNGMFQPPGGVPIGGREGGMPMFVAVSGNGPQDFSGIAGGISMRGADKLSSSGMPIFGVAVGSKVVADPQVE